MDNTLFGVMFYCLRTHLRSLKKTSSTSGAKEPFLCPRVRLASLFFALTFTTYIL
jgi:hypothetical protein